MGSPPKSLKALISSEKSFISYKFDKKDSPPKFSRFKLNGTRSLGNLSRIDLNANPLVYGPHAIITVNSKDPIKMKNSRPLSKINSRSNINEEESDIFSIKKKEASARNSPYLSHLKTKDREELLMELGSIVNTIDEELSVEVEIKKMMSKIVRKPKKSKSTNKIESEKPILTYDLDYLEIIG